MRPTLKKKNPEKNNDNSTCHWNRLFSYGYTRLHRHNICLLLIRLYIYIYIYLYLHRIHGEYTYRDTFWFCFQEHDLSTTPLTRTPIFLRAHWAPGLTQGTCRESLPWSPVEIAAWVFPLLWPWPNMVQRWVLWQGGEVWGISGALAVDKET